jgi:hypothetical protein
LIKFIVQFFLIDDVAGGDNKHISANGVEEAHLEGGCADGLNGAIFGEVDFVLPIVLDIGVDDGGLHGVEVVEVGAQRQQLVDVQVQRVLLVGARKGSVAVRPDYQEQVVRQFLYIHSIIIIKLRAHLIQPDSYDKKALQPPTIRKNINYLAYPFNCI